MPRHRALIVGAFRPVAAAVIGRWIAAGNEVAEFWYSGRMLHGQRRRDARLRWVAPRWSVTAQSRKYKFPFVEVPRLATWPQAVARAKATRADVLISVYFAWVVPPEILALFPRRAVNFHPAPLPRHRGPNPIAAMVMDRSIKTDGAMTMHLMSERLDEGDIVAQRAVRFPPDDDLFQYNLGLARAAAGMTADDLPRFLDGTLAATPQNPSIASYHRPTNVDMRISARQSAEEVRWRCETLGMQAPIEIEGIPGARVIGFSGVTGSPTGKPPHKGAFTIEFDAADARVRVSRNHSLLRLGRRVGQMVRLAGARDE
jgi:folate-dependent phosphoribosylglycinamide formyltransferase PurN